MTAAVRIFLYSAADRNIVGMVTCLTREPADWTWIRLGNSSSPHMEREKTSAFMRNINRAKIDIKLMHYVSYFIIKVTKALVNFHGQVVFSYHML